ncbi:MAG: helix-turn-helix transcriptional regulator [Cyanobacteria bacterium Co-bin13]|nr:helix-turn-helix transcriptional regulator [Cyanobacteria bacterium Co-bin13]
MASTPADYTGLLQQLMAQAGISSFRALARAAGLSVEAILQVRRGQIERLRLQSVRQLSQALDVPVEDLLRQFVPDLEQVPAAASAAGDRVAVLQAEYDRLQAQLTEQKQTLQAAFQAEALSTLEAWLLQWPTAAYAAQQNAQVPAARLVPLLQPVERLLTAWEVRAIAPVGAEVPYDPTLHQLMEGTAQPGDLVRIRYTGYWHADKLLYRAKVSPVKAPGASA